MEPAAEDVNELPHSHSPGGQVSVRRSTYIEFLSLGMNSTPQRIFRVLLLRPHKIYDF